MEIAPPRREKVVIKNLIQLVYVDRSGKTIEFLLLNDEWKIPKLQDLIVKTIKAHEDKRRDLYSIGKVYIRTNEQHAPIQYDDELFRGALAHPKLFERELLEMIVFPELKTLGPGFPNVLDRASLEAVIQEKQQTRFNVGNSVGNNAGNNVSNKAISLNKDLRSVMIEISCPIASHISFFIKNENDWKITSYITNGKEFTSLEDFVKMLDGFAKTISASVSAPMNWGAGTRIVTYQYDRYLLDENKMTMSMMYSKSSVYLSKPVSLFLPYGIKELEQRSTYTWLNSNSYLKKTRTYLENGRIKIRYMYVPTIYPTTRVVSPEYHINMLTPIEDDKYVKDYRDAMRMYHAQDKSKEYDWNILEFLRFFARSSLRLFKWYRDVTPSISHYGYVNETFKIERFYNKNFKVFAPALLKLLWNASSSEEYQSILDGIESGSVEDLQSIFDSKTANDDVFRDLDDPTEGNKFRHANPEDAKEKNTQINLDKFFAMFDVSYPFLPMKTILFSGLARCGEGERRIYRDIKSMDDGENGDLEGMSNKTYEIPNLVYATWHFNAALDQLASPDIESDDSRNDVSRMETDQDESSCVFVLTIASNKIKGLGSGSFDMDHADEILLNKGLIFRVDSVEKNVGFGNVVPTRRTVDSSDFAERVVKLEYLVRVSVLIDEGTHKGYGNGLVKGVSIPTQDLNDFNPSTLYYSLRNNMLKIDYSVYIDVVCQYIGTIVSENDSELTTYYDLKLRKMVQKEIRQDVVPDLKLYYLPFFYSRTYRDGLYQELESKISKDIEARVENKELPKHYYRVVIKDVKENKCAYYLMYNKKDEEETNESSSDDDY